ncbi:MAG: Asp-tRNA(Asn)/Glu-tRNA(Gln) amidotransferase subunit GatA [Candidatus Woesebacteria bacterium]|nr:Asp-tRNA(Asn)/Glu-tRNA(Gln) amidotransferase subunit GatA [Candidatus Woesebacteria bacterium]
MNIPLTIKETQDGLKSKKFSAVELVDAYLAQIKKYNSEYNVFLTVTEELAYAKAKEIDRGDKTSHLAGVIVSYKDIFLTKGVRTTAGSKILESYIPPYSATSVSRIEAAGAIPIGKLYCDAFAHGASGENSDFGRTLNPWGKEYVPGGSSSGSAASVSAGMSLISLGSDTGGSTRQPANFCNLVGLKPTYGVIPRYGVISMSSSLDTIGSFAHTVDDIEIMFDVMRGTDGYDSTVSNFKKPNIKNKFKLGIAKEYFIDGLDSEVENMINDVKKTYEKIGIEVVELTLPHTKYMVPVYYIIQPAEVSSNLGRFDGIRYGSARQSFGEEAKRRIMIGSYVLSAGYYDAYYEKAMKVRTKIINDFDEAFKTVDAIISPVSPTPAFKLGANTSDPLKMYLEDIYTTTANLVGIPGLAIPSTFSKSGLPIGFQLLGPRFSEHQLFELGKKYHKEIDYKPKIAL